MKYVGAAYIAKKVDLQTEKAAAIEDRARGGKSKAHWTDEIPDGFEHDEANVVEVAKQVLGEIDGPVFDRQLAELNNAALECKAAHEFFDVEYPGVMKDAIASLLGEATMTKFTALMMLKHCENNTTPNASALRRNVRKCKNSLESHEGNLYDKLQPCIKAWADRVSGFK